MANLNDAWGSGTLSPEVKSQLQSAFDKEEYNLRAETVTAGALSLEDRTSFVSVTGTAAYTLADGTYEGQQKLLICTVAASTPDGTVTPATFSDGTTITLNAVNESILLEWHATIGWKAVAVEGATIA